MTRRVACIWASMIAAGPLAAASNPQPASLPGEAVIRYINAARSGSYEEAERCWKPAKIGEMGKRYGGMKGYWRHWIEWEKRGNLEGAEVDSQDVNEEQRKAAVLFHVFYKDGTNWKCAAQLVQEGGAWRITEISTLAVGP